MRVRWYSIQLWSIRVLWGLIAFGLTVHKTPDDNGATVVGLVLGVIVFGVLTLIARSSRRRWAEQNS